MEKQLKMNTKNYITTGVAMKRLNTLLLVIGLFVAGCSVNESLNGPELASSQKESIKLPAKAANSIEKISTFNKEINGVEGGRINFGFDYESVDGSTVSVSGKLTIPANAFQYTTNITIIVDSDEAVVDFYPSPVTFDIPLVLNLTFEGLDLSNINASNTDFFYVNNSASNYELVSSSLKLVDQENGKLVVTEALLPHFSRYGFFN